MPQKYNIEDKQRNFLIEYLKRDIKEANKIIDRVTYMNLKVKIVKVVKLHMKGRKI